MEWLHPKTVGSILLCIGSHLIGVDIIIVSNKLGYTVLYTYANLYLSVWHNSGNFYDIISWKSNPI